MKYAKLINSFPVYAHNPIIHDGLWYGNPPGSVYEAEGYKPVHFNEQPTEPREGYQWVETWGETDTEIVQDWVLEEITELDGDQAMEFLFGGESDVE